MEAVIFVGLQASGKSTFYKEHFFLTHVRVNLDMLKTRHREKRFLETCIETGQRFVVDNTNPSRAEREVYIRAAKDGTSGSWDTTSNLELKTANEEMINGPQPSRCQAEASSARQGDWKRPLLKKVLMNSSTCESRME